MNEADSWSLLYASRRLWRTMRAARAEIEELKADGACDRGVPDDLARLDAKLIGIEQRSRAVLLQVAAILRQPVQRWGRIAGAIGH